MTNPETHEHGTGGPPPRLSEARLLARDLTGDLRCARCGYNLKGLSVRGDCPECGLPVRTTILVLVDPRAEELSKLTHPRLTAIGMVVWSVAALAAAVCVWGMRIAEVVQDRLNSTAGASSMPEIGLALIALSGLGALTLIRPHARLSRWGTARTAIGVALYVPLGWLFWTIHAVHDGAHPMPYMRPDEDDLARPALRLAMAGVIALIIVALRPHARLLAARSHLFRTGQIDRQSMLAMVAALGVAGVGDVLGLAVNGPLAGSDFLRTIAVALVALGSFLFTTGLFAAVLDTVRLRRVLASSAVGLSGILESNADRAKRLDAPETPA
ncbi:MAG: hypothetical protein R3B49_04045 [Phycisphaerales bacterium]